MKGNRTKQLLTQGWPVIGTFCFLPEPAVVEMSGLAGFDFVIIDTEHAGKDFTTLEAMVRAAEVANVTPLIRVAEISEKLILQTLELGAQGVVVPFVRDAQSARMACKAVRYPPEGTRGTCRSTRAASYGSRLDGFAAHMKAANDDILLVGMIEDQSGVDNIDEILAEGLDVCFLGRADLSSALGRLGQLDHPEVVAACDRVLKAALRRGCTVGNMIFDGNAATQQVADGYRFLVHSTDTQFLMRAFRNAVNEARDAPRSRLRRSRVAP